MNPMCWSSGHLPPFENVDPEVFRAPCRRCGQLRLWRREGYGYFDPQVSIGPGTGRWSWWSPLVVLWALGALALLLLRWLATGRTPNQEAPLGQIECDVKDRERIREPGPIRNPSSPMSNLIESGAVDVLGQNPNGREGLPMNNAARVQWG